MGDETCPFRIAIAEQKHVFDALVRIRIAQVTANPVGIITARVAGIDARHVLHINGQTELALQPGSIGSGGGGKGGVGDDRVIVLGFRRRRL
jgi:hypothetical protein